MFENSGEKLISLAKLTFVLTLVVCFIWAVSIWRYAKLLAVVVVVCGGVAGYITSLTIHAFGEVVSYIMKISYTTDEIQSRIPKAGSGVNGSGLSSSGNTGSGFFNN